MAIPSEAVFECRDIYVSIDGLEIVKGVSLAVRSGEIHAIMGPNGSGKSTLTAALMGHPSYRLEGQILIAGESVEDLPPDRRALAGMFYGFQYPVSVPGVTVGTFLRAATQARSAQKIKVRDFTSRLKQCFADLEIPWNFASRYLGDGFSGGEKKRLEILQMLMLEPKVVLLDEIDSGLDIDALKLVANGIQTMADKGAAVVLVTHYQRILNHVTPHSVHVFKDGKIQRTGGPEQALELEERGYEWLTAVGDAL